MRAVELFCGAGGTSLGLTRAGFDIILAYDISQSALRTYWRNLGEWKATAVNVKDQLFWAGHDATKVAPDLVAGSPPCQDFSVVGPRVEGKNALITEAYASLVGLIHPEWILMENVPPAAKSRAWKNTRKLLKRHGYGLTETVLNAAYYGVPQARKRFIVVGRLGEADGFLASALAEAASAKPTTVRDMLIPGLPEDDVLREIGYFFVRPYTGGRGVRSIDEPCPTVIRTTGAAPEPKYLKNPHAKDAIPATQAHVLTRRQISRIQGFPLSWSWPRIGTKKETSQAIANAVPPPLAEAIGRVILARHNGESIPSVEERFSKWLKRRGFGEAAVRNCRSRVNRARRLLGGRTFADAEVEIAKLENADGFVALPTATRSDLRTALRLYREWQSEVEARRARRIGRSAKPVDSEAVAA